MTLLDHKAFAQISIYVFLSLYIIIILIFFQNCLSFLLSLALKGLIFHSSYVALEHKTSLKSLGYICSNSQKYIVWVKIIHFSFMPKIIRILRSCSMKIFCKFPTVNISKLNF